MNKKGFVLMETIAVIVVLTFALVTIFTSYNKILSKVRTENKYDTSEYLYITKYIKKYIKDNNPSLSANDVNDPTNNIDILDRTNAKNLYGVEKIYILKNMDNFGGNETKFDAYMIDYLKKLDVRSKDELIIVEFKKTAKEVGTISEKKDSKDNILYETYIASLEWGK